MGSAAPWGEGVALPMKMMLWVRCGALLSSGHTLGGTLQGWDFHTLRRAYCGCKLIACPPVHASKPQDDFEELACSICFSNPTPWRGNLFCPLEVDVLFQKMARIRKLLDIPLSCFILKTTVVSKPRIHFGNPPA